MLHFARSTEHFPLTLTLSKREYLFSALPTCGRSADFQSAVSPNCIRQGVGSCQRVGLWQGSQSPTLRYGRALNTCQACSSRKRADCACHREACRVLKHNRGALAIFFDKCGRATVSIRAVNQ